MRASFILALIFIACPFQAAQECNPVNQNLPCKNSTDCSTGNACFPQTMLKGNRTFQNSSCQPLDSPCQLTSNQSGSVPCTSSRSFIYNSTQSGTCSECCVPGLAYSLYTCSTRQQEVNHAVLLAVDVANLNSTCSTQTAYTNRDMVVSLATGWMTANKSGLCLTNINISAPNDRSATAKVVTECKSSTGCTAQSSFREPCAPDGVAATEAVWRALGYDPQVGRLERITWSVLAVETSSRGTKKSSGARIIGIACGAIGGLVATCLGVAGAWFWRKRRKQLQRTRREERELMEDMRLDMLPHHMRYHELQKATGNFSSKVKLGEGGFGIVFKGKLGDGSLVAVKKMDLDIQGSTSGRLQFQAEVMSIGSIHHVNLVRLRGYCLHKAECLLVYEFMPNGSLDRWIFLDDHGKVLDWKLRYSIAIDVARGLTYLHEGCREQVLHLDIKPQNILLDENMRAKISDFGLAKLAERGKSNLVSGLRGTPGYMAPEWLGSSVSDKTDVYSYGMVLLQLITSRKAVQLSTSSQVVALGEVVDVLFHDGKIMELVDERLLGQNGLAVEAAYKYVRIGLLCIQAEPALRPTMSDVLKMLEGDAEA